jgi:hypothetical protein
MSTEVEMEENMSSTTVQPGSMSAPVVRTRRARVPKASLHTAGLLTLLVGAWAALVPFVGPLFGYSGDGAGSWHWSLGHALLFVVPGAAAFLAGIATMAGAARGRRGLVAAAGIVAVLSGAWLIVGPLAWPVLEGTSVFTTAASDLQKLTYWIGYSLGPGALLVALGAFTIGRDRFVLAGSTVTRTIEDDAYAAAATDL